jgi:hypothetical protein
MDYKRIYPTLQLLRQSIDKQHTKNKGKGELGTDITGWARLPKWQ